MAWVTRWKNARFGRFSLILAIITPSCLRVERAIIFFRSVSTIALIPAMNIVMVEIMRRVKLNMKNLESIG